MLIGFQAMSFGRVILYTILGLYYTWAWNLKIFKFCNTIDSLAARSGPLCCRQTDFEGKEKFKKKMFLMMFYSTYDYGGNFGKLHSSGAIFSVKKDKIC